MPAVNKRLISGVAGQRAMFASKPSRTEAAPRAVSFGQRTPFSRAAPRMGGERRGGRLSALVECVLFGASHCVVGDSAEPLKGSD